MRPPTNPSPNLRDSIGCVQDMREEERLQRTYCTPESAIYYIYPYGIQPGGDSYTQLTWVHGREAQLRIQQRAEGRHAEDEVAATMLPHGTRGARMRRQWQRHCAGWLAPT